MPARAGLSTFTVNVTAWPEALLLKLATLGVMVAPAVTDAEML